MLQLMIHHLIIIYIRKDKVLEECEDDRLGKDDPGCHNDTSDESKVQIHELRDIAGRASFHCGTFLGLHTVNMSPEEIKLVSSPSKVSDLLDRRALARIPLSHSGLDILQ